jgi:glutamate N-acetyltransferase/amino-acid N-acetyltransferase
MDIPKGFQFAGLNCGIKPNNLDLCLIASDAPCVAAGVYTQNLVRAACIDWNREITPTETARAVVINSGNANACTGQQGAADCQVMARTVSARLRCEAHQVCVLSTGVIGKFLPMDRVIAGIDNVSRAMGSSQRHFLDAADAILTTDNARKIGSTTFVLDGQPGKLVGMAKGAGMIGPNMATMLAVIVTDIRLTAATADKLLRKAVNHSFNRISVEGHTSTNDAVIFLCSNEGTMIEAESRQAHEFSELLDAFCLELAKKIPSDGEGATKLIEINVSGTGTNAQADRVARTIAASALVKTAVTGCDPNWGRVISAVGYASVEIDLSNCSLMINGQKVFESGRPLPFDERSVSDSMAKNAQTVFDVCLGHGSGSATHWTSNLTTHYVTLNSKYRT